MKKHKVIYICTTCGTENTAERRRRGNGFVELVLWLALLVPGLLYSMWRSMEDVRRCYTCGHETIIPIATPMGRRLYEELEPYRGETVLR